MRFACNNFCIQADRILHELCHTLNKEDRKHAQEDHHQRRAEEKDVQAADKRIDHDPDFLEHTGSTRSKLMYEADTVLFEEVKYIQLRWLQAHM